MVYYLVTTLHVIVCVILILVVLLQSGKGADLAGAFGGGATQTAFGSRGPASFLSKATTGAAIVFMLTSMLLSTMTAKQEGAKSILETTPGAQAPAKAPAPATNQPAARPPTPEEIRQRQLEIEKKQQQNQSATPAAPQGATAKPSTEAPKPTPPPPDKKQ